MQKDFTVEKNDLLLMMLYAPGSTGQVNEPVRGVTRLMKLIFLTNEKIKNPDRFLFEPYKMGPYSGDVYSALTFFSTFPSSGDPVLKIERSGHSTQDPDAVKYIIDSADDETTLEDGFGNNAKFYLTERGQKLAKLIWERTDKDQTEIIRMVKAHFSSMPLKQLLKYVYDTFPEMTVKSTIIEQVYE